MHVVTAEEFAALKPKYKGYYCYMYGKREDQPNVPEEWVPENPRDQAAYDEGQFNAMLAAQDSEE